MKFDSTGLDPARVMQQLAVAYGLPLTGLRFLPLGEAAYHYVAETDDGARYFVTAQHLEHRAELEAAYTCVAALGADCGIEEVVAPLRTQRGDFTTEHDGYSLALFPFIPSTTAFDAPLSETGLTGAAGLLARLHDSRACLRTLPVRVERFATPYPAQIRACLDAVRRLPRDANDYQRRLAELLLREQDDLLAFLHETERLRAHVRGLTVDQVVTHGDPNFANILVDTHGGLHLVDWDDIALGPAERDLSAFTGARFEPFLRAYAVGRTGLRLNLSLFAYYQYRWTAQEIADYATRILFHEKSGLPRTDRRDPREDEHAWQELAPYLPLPRERMRRELQSIEGVVKRVGVTTDDRRAFDL